MKTNDSGITLMALILTIIVLLIIVSISVYEGKELIAKSMIQSLENNMLIIQAKAKEYAEEIDAKIWTESDKQEDAENGYTPKEKARNNYFTSEKNFEGPVNIENQDILQQISSEIKNDYVAYTVTADAITKMGLDEIKNETYIVIYSKNNYKLMDVIYPKGIKYRKVTYDIYTLSNLQSVLSNE